MIIGIDVGGTHTDAVLLKNGKLVKKTKFATRPDHLLESLVNATDYLLQGEDSPSLERIAISTTLSTNAIIQGKTDRVGLIVSPGPGVAPAMLPQFPDVYFLSGYINHRGTEVVPITEKELKDVRDIFRSQSIRHAGVVGKFSCRNASQEKQVEQSLKNITDHVSMGHQMSGQLNFPRRIATTYLNVAVWSLHRTFTQSVQDFIREKDILAPCYILKADGGTIALSQSLDKPVATILSGPAASIMGILSMGMPHHDAITIDMGGTTTDIAVLMNGDPLLEPLGVTIGGYRTLIRGLRSRSIGIGGDSVVKIIKSKIVVGPERMGPAAAFGGTEPTPTDAMVVLGFMPEGDRDAALRVLHPLSGQLGCSIGELAEKIFSVTCDEIVKAVKEELMELNEKPVYTIREFLTGRRIIPKYLYVVGGPARIMAAPLGERLGCMPCPLDNAEVANAIGVAVSRITDEITVMADTERRTLTIAEEGLQVPISRSFSHEEAIAFAKEKLQQRTFQAGAPEKKPEMEIVEDQVFPMVRDFSSMGENIRIKVQIKPGIISSQKGTM